MRHGVRRGVLAGLALVVLGALLTAVPVQANTDMTLRGRLDLLPLGPGGSLSVSPGVGGAVTSTIFVAFGEPPIAVPVVLNPETKVETPDWKPVTLVDGMTVEVHFKVVDNFLVATWLEVQDPADVLLRGTLSGLPTTGVGFPLPPGASVDVGLTLANSTLLVVVRLGSSLELSGNGLTLKNGDTASIKAVLRNGVLLGFHLDPW